WIRPLDRTSTKSLAGTDGATFPFWAPGGGSLGFFADGKLKRVDLGSEEVKALADAPNGRGGTWNADDVLLFPPATAGPVMRIEATGGTPYPATQLAAGQPSHRWPQFLPDGRHFLFLAVQTEQRTLGIFVGSLDGSQPTRLTDDNVAGL